MGPLISYLSSRTSPGFSEARKSYPVPQTGQKPNSRDSLAVHGEPFSSMPLQKRLRSGTTPSMTLAIGSSGGSGGSGTMPDPPNRRLVLRVERVLRVETRPRTLALRLLTAEGPLPGLRTEGGAVRVDRVEPLLAPVVGAAT